jgi:acyl transferase domain-containing protein
MNSSALPARICQRMREDAAMNSAEVRQLIEDQVELTGRLRARIRDLEDAARAPVAVLGMGLRFPGGIDSPDEYWDFLCGAGSVLTEIPRDRPGLRAVYEPGPCKPGRSYVGHGGFLTDIASFDADFFGISQREAELIDPQQRLLLETAWEALERAGIAVRRDARLDAGVFLGVMASEYGERLALRADKTPIDPYYTTGGGLCFGAGRIGHVMGFRGPAVSVDTACSSSLTALHLAVRALRGGECRYALVCGSNMLLSGNLMVSLCQSGALSPDGRSKSFLASADGYGRAEGVGVLVLARLTDAEREGHPILALVRGTATNHDGAAAALTVPNGPAQQEVIRAALADAGADPADVGWIEAHGTGTRLGDPIEVGALDGILGAAVRARETPLAIGSVKSRLGHMEAASGVAAVMKTVLMLGRGVIPPGAAPGDGALNPHVPWHQLGFTVPRHAQPWPRSLPRRIAGVNSFGMSGTNAHAVLEAYRPAVDGPQAGGARHELLVLSAKDPAALAELSDSVRKYLEKADPAILSSVCHTLRAGRAPFAHRAAVTGGTAGELAGRLASRRRRDDPAAGPAPGPAPGVVAVTLRIAPGGAAPVAAGLAELAEAFPRLAAAQADLPQDPETCLAGLLTRLGLHPTCGSAADAGDPPASLEWQTDEGPGQCAAPLVDGRLGTADVLLAGALARLFEAGADLRLGALRRPGARLLGDLPTYPFRHRRFWVNEEAPTATGVPAAGGAGGYGQPGTPLPQDRDGIAAYLVTELRDVLRADEELDTAKSFLDAGGDSFISTLYMQRIETRFRVGLTPEDLPTDMPLSVLVERLSEHITMNLLAQEPGQ